MVRAAHDLGVSPDAQWVLALGRGDDLQRATFHLLAEGQRRWVLKFARVAGAAASFARDKAGLDLVRSVGGADRSARADASGVYSGRQDKPARLRRPRRAGRYWSCWGNGHCR